MAGFDRVVQYTLNLIAGAAGADSVNIPAIITDETLAVGHAFGSGYAKRYKVNELASVATDFGDDGDTYDAATAIATQTPKVNEFYIIKRATPTAGVYEMVFDAALVASNTIAGTVNGNAISVNYATSNAATLTAIAAAIQALSEVATAVSDGTDTITITFESQVDPAIGTFTVTGGADQAEVTVTATTPAVTIASDIANAIAETQTNKWFMLLPTTTNKYAILAAAEYIETLGGQKMMLAHSTDSAIYTVGSTDVASMLKALNYNFTGLIYHDDSTEMIHAAWASNVLATPPGKVQFSMKELTNVTASPLTSAQLAIAEGKNANTYTDAGPDPLTLQGVVASGIPLEGVRDASYAVGQVNVAIYNGFRRVRKFPYDVNGEAMLDSNANGRVGTLVTEGVFSGVSDPPAAFIVPSISTLTQEDRNAHIFAGCELRGETVAGAIKVSYTANIKAS